MDITLHMCRLQFFSAEPAEVKVGLESSQCDRLTLTVYCKKKKKIRGQLET